MPCVFGIRTGISEHHPSDSADVLCLLRMAAHQRPDVTSCGASAGESSASEVGTVDGIATPPPPPTTTTAITSTTTTARAKNYKQATWFTKRLTSLVMSW